MKLIYYFEWCDFVFSRFRNLDNH